MFFIYCNFFEIEEQLYSGNDICAFPEPDSIARKVKHANKDVNLTATEYKIPELLLSNKGKVFDRILIAEKIWRVSEDLSGKDCKISSSNLFNFLKDSVFINHENFVKLPVQVSGGFFAEGV